MSGVLEHNVSVSHHCWRMNISLDVKLKELSELPPTHKHTRTHTDQHVTLKPLQL